MKKFLSFLLVLNFSTLLSFSQGQDIRRAGGGTNFISSTAIGVTNISGVLSANIGAGTNIVLTTNGNQIVINNSGSGSGTITTNDLFSLMLTRDQGHGNYFPGNRSLSIPSVPLSTTDFTFYTRVRLPDYTPAAAHIIYQTHTPVSSNCFRLILTNSASVGKFLLAFVDNSAIMTQYLITPTTALVDGDIYTFIVTVSRVGLATLYVNGYASGTVNVSASSSVDIGSGDISTTTGTIGSNFIGTMFDFRAYKSVLSASDALAETKRGYVDPLLQWSGVWFDLALGYGDTEILPTIYDRASTYNATATSTGVLVHPANKDTVYSALAYLVPTNGFIYFDSLVTAADFDLTNGAWYGTGPVMVITPHEDSGSMTLSRGQVVDVSPCCGTNVAPSQVDIGSYNFNVGGGGPTNSYQSLRLRADTNYVLVGSSFGGSSTTFIPAAQPMLVQDQGGNVGIGLSISQADITPITDKLKVNGQIWDMGSIFKLGTTPNQFTVGILANPNTFVIGSPGDTYYSSTGGTNATLWRKETGSATTTGWYASVTADNTPYDPTSWNGSLLPPTKDTIRDDLILRPYSANPAFTGTATFQNITVATNITLSSGTPGASLIFSPSNTLIAGSSISAASLIQPSLAYTPRGALRFGEGSTYLTPATTPMTFGTNNFSIHQIVRITDWTSTQMLMWNNRNSTTNSCYFQLQTDGSFSFVFLNSAGATATYTLTPDVALIDNDIYDFILSVDRAGYATLYINSLSDGNGDGTIVRVDVSASAAVDLGNNAGAPLAFYSLLGVGYEFQVYNTTLSDNEAKVLAKTGVPAYHSQYGGFNYTSDFSVNADGFTSALSTVAGNIDGIGGSNDVMRVTAASTESYATRNLTQTFHTGQKLRLSYSVYIPSANTSLVKVAPRNQYSLDIGFSTQTPAGNTWTDYVETINAAQLGTYELGTEIAFWGLTTGGTTNVTNGDLIYYKNVNLTYLGATMDLDFQRVNPMKSLTLRDKSYNAYNSDLNSTNIYQLNNDLLVKDISATSAVVTDSSGRLTNAPSGKLPITLGGTGQATAILAFDAIAPTTTRGDLIRRGASANERVGLGPMGTMLISNGTDAVYRDPLNYVYFSSEFFSAGTFTTDGFTSSTSGGTVAGGSGTATHPGIFNLNVASVIGPIYAQIRTSSSGILFGGGITSCGWLVFSPASLSDGTDTYQIRSGFIDVSGDVPSDGAYFEYDQSINTHWQFCTMSNGTQTTSNSSITVATSTWYYLQVVVNAAGTSVEYFINGTSVGTQTTNIPTGTGRETGCMTHIEKTLGGVNTRTLGVDFAYFYQQTTANRY